MTRSKCGLAPFLPLSLLTIVNPIRVFGSSISVPARVSSVGGEGREGEKIKIQFRFSILAFSSGESMCLGGRLLLSLTLCPVPLKPVRFMVYYGRLVFHASIQKNRSRKDSCPNSSSRDKRPLATPKRRRFNQKMAQSEQWNEAPTQNEPDSPRPTCCLPKAGFGVAPPSPLSWAEAPLGAKKPTCLGRKGV